MKTFLRTVAVGLVTSASLIASSAVHASITVNAQATSDYATAKGFESTFLSGLSPDLNVATEDFESGFTVTPVGANETSIDTSVGEFRQITQGGIDDGLRILDAASTPFQGRRDTTNSDKSGKWLDSNDSKHVRWFVDFANDVYALGFFLTDVNDVSASMFARFRDGTEKEVLSFGGAGGNAPNGEFLYVTAEFMNPVTRIDFRVDTDNDGWGIDDISVAAVPLPFAGLLMLTGLGGAAVAYRRRKPA